MPQDQMQISHKSRLKNIAKYSHLDSAVGTNNNSEINEQAPTKVGVIAWLETVADEKSVEQIRWVFEDNLGIIFHISP